MKFLRFVFLFLALTVSPLHADESSLISLAQEHQMSMKVSGNQFSGEGWNHIATRVNAASSTLFGEDHFTNEIPQLLTAIGDIGEFDNFYIEIDPFSTRLMEHSLVNMSDSERNAFNKKYGDTFSFYALQPEYELLERMVKTHGAHLLGSDQVVMFSDRLVLSEWIEKSENDTARDIYRAIDKASKEHLQAFINDQNNLMYFMTPEFSEQLDVLENLTLSAEEMQLIGYMKTSVDIYKTQSHSKRVQLIKHHLMQDYDNWRGKRNFFKYGANHLTRGESFLTVHDIGVVVANLSEANYESTYHVMVLGESGKQGSPFRGFPASDVDQEGFYLKHLKPFFTLTEGEDWAVFDLVPIRRAMLRGQINIDDTNLRRSIMGYDTLVLIPEVTAAKFPVNE